MNNAVLMYITTIKICIPEDYHTSSNHCLLPCLTFSRFLNRKQWCICAKHLCWCDIGFTGVTWLCRCPALPSFSPFLYFSLPPVELPLLLLQPLLLKLLVLVPMLLLLLMVWLLLLLLLPLFAVLLLLLALLLLLLLLLPPPLLLFTFMLLPTLPTFFRAFLRGLPTILRSPFSSTRGVVPFTRWDFPPITPRQCTLPHLQGWKNTYISLKQTWSHRGYQNGETKRDMFRHLSKCEFTVINNTQKKQF